MRLTWAMAAVCVAASAAMAAEPEGVVLTQDGYFRQYYEFGLMRIDTAALKAEGEQLLRADGIKRYQAETRRHLKDRGIDWEKADWRDLAVVHFCRTQLGDDSRAVELMPTIPPPEPWSQADFDDASWFRQRIGRLPRDRWMAESYDFSWHLIRAIYYRSYFHVDDPAKAGELVLNLSYRGGARVLLNGQEVTRGHYPAGQGGDPHAEPYPREAYIVLPDEGPQPRGGCFADIRCEFDQAPPYTKGGQSTEYRRNAMGHGISRKGWDRLKGLRDRRLENVKLPANLLRKGANVLAVEIRGANFHPQILPSAGAPNQENWAVGGGTDNNTWDHCRLLSLQLKASGAGVPSCTTRPAGPQVWVEDMHRRVFSRDYNAPGWPMGKVRLVGAPNGTFSAQVVVGASQELAGLKATVTELKPAGAGKSIPAAAMTVSYLKGRPITELAQLGFDRCLGIYGWSCPMAVVAVNRYGVRLENPPAKEEDRRKAEAELLSAFRFYDQVAAKAPATVPGDSVQPIWLSLRLPEDAQPGKYAGALRVEAAGMAPVDVPIELEVIGWRIPSPSQFQLIVESEQSPYGVAKAWQLPLWSEQHWQRMDRSFAQLARLGQDFLFVPVLLNSEFGNRQDCSMIKWTRKSDGKLAFDYAILDRYVELATKHLGRPRVICIQIMHGCPSGTNAVKILDEASGKEEIVDVGPGAADQRGPLWQAFATAMLEHARQKGWERSLYWGHVFDTITDPGLIKLMQEFAPGVPWAAGAHARQPDPTFHAVARAYGSDITDRSLKGWKNPFIHLVMPRTNGSVICVEGTSTPFTYRVLCDRGVYCGMNGIGRMGADYFGMTWFDGFSGGQYLLVGRSCVQTLWPGPDGAESSTRNEAMLEGIQEAEARIFMEQALDRGLIAGELAQQAQQVLDDHVRQTLYIPGGTAGLTLMEYTGDWQARSARLLAMAAKVGQAVGIDVDKTQIGNEANTVVFGGEIRTGYTRKGLPLPALGKAQTSLTIRNWTGQPRAWKASTTQPWIKPARTQGTLTGQETLDVTLDGAGLKAGEVLTGTLTVTDGGPNPNTSGLGAPAQAGRNYDVQLAVEVLKPLELSMKDRYFNVTVGQSDAREYLLTNRTDARQAWRIECSAAWMKAEPASGELAPGGSACIKLTAAPPDKQAADHAAKVTFTAPGASVKEELDFRTLVIPPYQEPAGLPQGQAVPLETVSKDLLVRHRSVDWFSASKTHSGPTFGPTLNVWHGLKPVVVGKKTYPTALWVLPAHETVYKIEGKGYQAFAAEVGWNAMVARNNQPGHTAVRLSFEVYIDGQVRAQSGLMKSTDAPRLIVVDGLDKAKELRLVTRTDFLGDLHWGYANWAEPKLYTK